MSQCNFLRPPPQDQPQGTDVNVQQKPRQDEDSIGGLQPDAALSKEEVNVDDEACINSPDVVTSSKNETDDNNNTNGECGFERVISNKNSKTAIFTEKSAQEGEVVANKLKQHAVIINNAVQPKEANTN